MAKWRLLLSMFFIFIVPLVFLPNALIAGSGTAVTWQEDGAAQRRDARPCVSGTNMTRQEDEPDNTGLSVVISDYSAAAFTINGNAVDNKSRNAASHAIAGREELPRQMEGSDGKSETAQVQAHENYGKLPLFFIQNNGQMDERVKFYEKGSGHAMFFTKDGVHILLTPAKPRIRPYETGTDEPEYTQQQHSFPQAGVNGVETGEEINTMPPLSPNTDKRSLSQLTTHNSQLISLVPVGANRDFEIIAEGLQRGRVNYFIGNNPEEWRTDIPTYSAVVYKEIYDGIDIKFYGNNRQLEYDVIVKPGIDPSQVRFAYEGIEDLRVNDTGELEIILSSQPERPSSPSIPLQRGTNTYPPLAGVKGVDRTEPPDLLNTGMYVTGKILEGVNGGVQVANLNPQRDASNGSNGFLTPENKIIQRRPYIYQEIDGKRVEVAGDQAPGAAAAGNHRW